MQKFSEPLDCERSSKRPLPPQGTGNPYMDAPMVYHRYYASPLAITPHPSSTLYSMSAPSLQVPQLLNTSPPAGMWHRDAAAAAPVPHGSTNKYQRAPHDDSKAMWVGNLPPNVTEQAIRQYFSALDLVSIANLTRSRCAFINLRSEAAVTEAVKLYHNMTFNGCLLVCRPRTSSSNSGSDKSSASTSPSRSSSRSSSSAASSAVTHCTTTTAKGIQGAKILSEYAALNSGVEAAGTYQFEDRFFIMKSLSIGDLEIARRTGYWATQLKNEPILEKAFGNTRNVYLIFSANKSGEFYGCARMESAIDPEKATDIDWLPVGSLNHPNDKQRDKGDSDKYPQPAAAASSHPTIPRSESPEADCPEHPKWGTNFKIRWIITHPLPFARTKHLRNSWNANKQIKVSRDGTEVETAIAKRFIQEWEEDLRRVQETSWAAPPGFNKATAALAHPAATKRGVNYAAGEKCGNYGGHHHPPGLPGGVPWIQHPQQHHHHHQQQGSYQLGLFPSGPAVWSYPAHEASPSLLAR
ncbi:hypothetical protein HK104_009966 [Borealophlyctis nickersoniae]|nr:hypothetical protein HK104_009966 [Borealophlyctis nickersoniae]